MESNTQEDLNPSPELQEEKALPEKQQEEVKGQQSSLSDQEILKGLDENGEPMERDLLPVFRDENQNFSVWTFVANAIGRDITKITAPVHFNEPMSITQKVAVGCEYNDILDKAMALKGEENALKRMAYVAIHSISINTAYERSQLKPFNPLLGETFELVTDKFEFICEQVSHHPPVSAWICKGKSGYKMYDNARAKLALDWGGICVVPIYPMYYELEGMGPDGSTEVFEVRSPNISAHNLVFGEMYIDVGGESTVQNVNRPEHSCRLTYHKKGWTEAYHFLIQGQVLSNEEVKFEIDGRWNDKISLVNKEKQEEPEVVFNKNPYHQEWRGLYGYSHFAIQLNYFPKRMHNVVPPTDARRRPDLRALENGDRDTAAAEKDKLEEKQRAVRRERENQGLGQVPPIYFKEEYNERVKENYWMYNGTYFEKDRKAQDWSKSAQIY